VCELVDRHRNDQRQDAERNPSEVSICHRFSP
jgi:hypothetical protein